VAASSAVSRSARKTLALVALGMCLVMVVFVLWLSGAPSRFFSKATPPQPAITALLAVFDRYPIVALAETHWSRPQGDFYVSLIRAPGFSGRVNDIVLECANPLYQPILDRYMNGEDVPFAQISQVWRNTTKVMGWESPIYQRLLETVRDVNRGLPPDRRLRVLAGDSPIDWSRIRTHADWENAYQGDDPFVSVIAHEVLAKRHKALLIMGVNHLTRGGTRDGDADVTTRVEKRYPHSVYVVLLGQVPLRAEPEIFSWQPPALYPLKGTRLGGALFLPRRFVEDVADAYLYLGKDEMAWPDWAQLQGETGYFKELQRRHLIEFGCSLDLDRWKSLERPCS
jgi:hypothetical protein